MLERLVYCAASDPEVARKGRWLNRLLLGFIALGILAVVSALLLLPLSVDSLANAAVVLLVIAIYWLSRSGFVTAAAVSLLVIMLAAFTGAAFLQTDNVIALGYPALFVLIIMTAGAFLNWRAVLGITVAVVAVVLWYYYFSNIAILVTTRRTSPEAIALFVFTVITLVVAASLLSLLSSQLLREALQDVRGRNADLQAAYSQLAAQSQREHDLGADIGELATQLSDVSTRQASGVSTQARLITEVVSVVAELHAAADQIAARADEVRQAADSALLSVQRGQELVLGSREAVQRNRERVQVVIDRMTSLDQITGRITQFVNRIRGLSDETHLLALNATIEAAGAGPLGRRFGVVAAEVQNLSNRSNEIVDQIRELIEELQQAGRVTIDATQGSIEVADEVERLADEVRNAQEQVVSAVQRTTELVHLISSSTTEQTTATAQMTRTMEEIAQVADTTNTDTHALERAIQQLTQAADLLNSTIAHLRAESPA